MQKLYLLCHFAYSSFTLCFIAAAFLATFSIASPSLLPNLVLPSFAPFHHSVHDAGNTGDVSGRGRSCGRRSFSLGGTCNSYRTVRGLHYVTCRRTRMRNCGWQYSIFQCFPRESVSRLSTQTWLLRQHKPLSSVSYKPSGMTKDSNKGNCLTVCTEF